MKRIVLLVLCALVLSGCGAVIAFVVQFAPENKYKMDSSYENARYTNYHIDKTVRTETGIRIDTSGQNVDLKAADRLVKELEVCLNVKIDRRAFTVKVAPDWRQQECAGRQLFPCKLPAFEQTKCMENACPCGCAGILQWPSTVVVTPDLAALKHELIHLVTRKMDHADPVFAKCQ